MLLAAIDIDVPSGVTAYGPGTALAALAAVLCGVGTVLQHEVAVGSSSGGSLRWRSMASSPGWLAGQGAVVAGTLLQVVALGLAPVSIVQPLLALGLVVALGMRAVRDRRRPSGLAFLGAACTAVGLGAFLVAASPGTARAGSSPHPLAVAVTVVATAALVGAAVRFGRGAGGALACGIAAGVALGVAAVLVSAALKVLAEHGLLAALGSASLWGAAVASVLAQYCSQQAFSRGSISLSLPALTVVDPLAAVPVAALLLGEHLAPGHAAVWAPAAVLAAVGVVLLAVRSGAHGPAVDEGAPATGRAG